MEINNYFSANNYPGRGIIIGLSEDKSTAIMAYFIMGRSNNSRNRVFCMEADQMRTKAYDESKVEDPSLIIYWPLRKANFENKAYTIITNGDQTDDIAAFLNKGLSFDAALKTRCYEPDAPNYTPRISGLLTFSEGKFCYDLSILKKGKNDDCSRFFYHYDAPQAGLGHTIHTYANDGNPLPSYSGEPQIINLPKQSAANLSQNIWQSLDAENRVALLVSYINIKNPELREDVLVDRWG